MEPTKHEERVLAGRRATRLQSLDRSAAQWVIATALRVEIRRLLPQMVGELVPPQPEVTTLCVERVEERAAVEDREWPHASQPTFLGTTRCCRSKVPDLFPIKD